MDAPAALAATPTLRHRPTRWTTFLRNRVSVAGAVLTIAVTAAAIAAPLLTPWSPVAQDPAERLHPPGPQHLLGQDTFGRDVLTRILYGGRISLLVGVGSVVLGATAGTLVGLAAGYAGGWTEHVLMRFLDILMAFPSLLLGLIVLAVLGSGLGRLIVAIGIVLTPPFARIAHGSTLSMTRQEFVDAARAVGAAPARILLRHILPNILGEVIVMSGLLAANAIRIEASLSFIGLGVSPPTPTWGTMIREGTPYLINAPWLSVAPGLAILAAVLGFNLVGDGLRDVIDPRLRV